MVDKNPCQENAVSMKTSDDDDEDGDEDDNEDDDGYEDEDEDEAFQCYSMPSVRGIS